MSVALQVFNELKQRPKHSKYIHFHSYFSINVQAGNFTNVNVINTIQVSYAP